MEKEAVMRCWLPGVARNSIPLLIALIWPAGSLAGDWPMWRYDAGHTAASPDDLPGELHWSGSGSIRPASRSGTIPSTRT